MTMPATLARRLALGACWLLAIAPAATGQGLVVDRRPDRPVAGSFDVDSVVVDADVRDQVARVRVSQTLSNPTSDTIEAEYLFPVPDAGTIQDFVLLVDGKELTGELMDADKARRIYEEIVRRKRDPALLEYMGRGLIRTSVFPIPPRAERTVTMTYTQLLRKDGDVVEFSYPFGTQKFTSKPIRMLEFALRVEGRTPIKSIYSPSHELDRESRSDREARVSYTARDVVPTADLRVFYTTAEGGLGASVLSVRPEKGEDGYFLLLASPEVAADDDDREAAAKTVVFVLDRSGSMTGEKIEQARDALKFVLNNLNEDDTFNVVVYDDRVETFKPELQRYSKSSRDEAIGFVENIRPGGSTNIDAALRTSLEMLRDDGRPRYVIFLTDGLPTAGETDELRIAERAREANAADARIFPFGVGFDVNARLLDRLSADHGGASAYVKPDEDIEASVSRFYSKLTSPVLADLEVEMTGTDLNRTYPRDLPDLFEGGQLAWVGRYTESGETTVRLTGKVGDDRRTFTFEADLAGPGEGSRYDFVEPLWASRRIGELIDQIDLKGRNPELTEELVRLSTRYGILTPYTSFLAEEETDLNAVTLNLRQAEDRLERLSEVRGEAGVGQRANKAYYQRADQLDAASAPTIVLAPGGVPFNSPPNGQAGGPGQPRSYDFAGRGLARTESEAAGRAQRPLSAAAPAPAAGLPAVPMMAGGMGGMAGMSGPISTFALGGSMAVARDLSGNAVAVASVRSVGSKTFYLREGRWVDAAVTPEAEASARVVTQFSDPYFELARRLPANQAPYLSFPQPVVVLIDGTVYRIDPAPADGEG